MAVLLKINVTEITPSLITTVSPSEGFTPKYIVPVAEVPAFVESNLFKLTWRD